MWERVQWLLMVLGMALLAACSQSQDSAALASARAEIRVLGAKVEQLEAEVRRLKAENEELKNTPARQLADVDSLIKTRDLAKAQAALERLKVAFPQAPETASAQKLVDNLNKVLTDERKEAERVKVLGFKVLKEVGILENGGLKLTGAVTTGQTWNYDSHDFEYSYREASRGSTFVLMRANITAASQDPWLPGIGVYALRDGALKLVATMSYEFAKWMSYGSYLGNGHDFRNDFAHTQTIPFSLGAEIDAGIMNEPVFVIGVAEACFQRTTQQFGRPPVQYVKRTCTKLKDTLDAKEASGPGYYVLKIFNGKKL